MVLISEMKFGIKAQSINEIANRITNIDWYKKVGEKDNNAEKTFHRFIEKLKVKHYEIQWITKEQTPAFIGNLNVTDSEIWSVLCNLPDVLKKKINEAEQADLLEKLIETVPQEVFHVAFQKAFQQFGEEKQVHFFVGLAMYMAVLICTAELAGEVDLFVPLLELLESGHVPVGLDGNIIFLL